MNLNVGGNSYDIPLEIPQLLWHYYVQYLWYYDAHSWVATIAYTFRVLSIMFATPIVILMLLVRLPSENFHSLTDNESKTRI
jgi:hypothetical protein